VPSLKFLWYIFLRPPVHVVVDLPEEIVPNLGCPPQPPPCSVPGKINLKALRWPGAVGGAVRAAVGALYVSRQKS
jgi:hypothetical protein